MGIAEKPRRMEDIRTWYGEQPIWHQYTMGVAGERFFRALKDRGVIMASKCPRCGCLLVPGRMYCAECFVHTTDWVEVGPRGTVNTFTVLHEDLDDQPLAEPVVVAFIQFAGARGGLIHRLGEIKPGDVACGMAVEPVLRQERAGGLEDIQYFKPAR